MIDELSTWLSSHIAAYAQGSPDALSKALKHYADKGVLCELLDCILDDDQRIAAITARSYQHPNGFVKITLVSTDRFQLRLHIWWRQDGSILATENIHNHRWDFASILLLGGYRYQEFAPAPAGRSFYAYTYESDRRAAAYSLLCSGRRNLDCSFDAHLSAGTSYTLRSAIYHRIISDPHQTTATLVLQGPDTRSQVEVFAENLLDSGQALPLARLSPESLRRNIRELTRRLGT